MLRLEANGSTGEGVVAAKGFLSEEPRVGWVDAGGARLLPAPSRSARSEDGLLLLLH